MRSITKLMFLCVFFTASITCRKETCVIVDKHTYTITDINTINSQGDVFLASYYERDPKNEYYQKEVLRFGYNTRAFESVKNDYVAIGSGVGCTNSTNKPINVTIRANGVEFTLQLPKNGGNSLNIYNVFPKNATLEIIKVEYL